jgi:hypothetical protein
MGQGPSPHPTPIDVNTPRARAPACEPLDRGSAPARERVPAMRPRSFASALGVDAGFVRNRATGQRPGLRLARICRLPPPPDLRGPCISSGPTESSRPRGARLSKRLHRACWRAAMDEAHLANEPNPCSVSRTSPAPEAPSRGPVGMTGRGARRVSIGRSTSVSRSQLSSCRRKFAQLQVAAGAAPSA